MKRFFIGITLLFVLLVAYWVWPFFGLRSLTADIQARDPAALSEDVDFVRLRRSLTEQIIAAYLQVTGRAKKLSPFENVVAIGIGNSIADPFVAQLVTPENLLVLLRGQAVPTDFGNVSFKVGELPSVALGSVWAAWLSRLRLRTLFYWCTCFVTIRRAVPHPDGATAMEVEADGSRVTGLVAKPVRTGIGEEVSMNRTQGEQPAYVPYPSSSGFADVSPSSAAFRTHLSAHPPAAHVRIEHGPPGPRLQFVPVRTAPIVGHLRLGNPIETFSRHTDSAADFVGAERAMEVFMAELSEDEKQSLDDALSTLDDLYEATLKADGGFHSEETEAIAKLAEEAMACVLSVLDPEMYDAVQRDCPEKKLGREARAVRPLSLAETPQKLAV